MVGPIQDLSQRRLLSAMLLLGVFVLCDIALFGWLIFRSLSQREIEQVLLEARAEAEELASQIAGDAARRGDDLLIAIATESETQTYIDSELSQREIVERVEIWDREGRLVFRSEREETRGDLPEIETAGEPPRIETRQLLRETPFDRVEVPVGEFGSVVIGISRKELEGRLRVLRSDLIRQAAWIAGLTVVLFLGAYVMIWKLLRRTRRLEDKANESERLAYIGTLASGLAHEIRSPLNSLNLNMQMLEEEVDGGGRLTSGRRLMAITRSEISRLEGLVNDFLSYARPGQLDLEVVTVGTLLEHAADVLRGQIEDRGVRFTLVNTSEEATARVDRAQINQLLLNLVQNAIEATAGTGREAEVRLEARREGDLVVIGVRDNGAGLSEEERSRMFEVFYSTRKGGTGLGLAIVERIAKAHDATVRVRSVKGKGTLVEVCLPLWGRAASPALAASGAGLVEP